LRLALSTSNRKAIVFILALFFGLLAFYMKKIKHEQILVKINKAVLQKDWENKVRFIIQEAFVEANFMQNVAFIKYKDKTNDEKSRIV